MTDAPALKKAKRAAILNLEEVARRLDIDDPEDTKIELMDFLKSREKDCFDEKDDWISAMNKKILVCPSELAVSLKRRMSQSVKSMRKIRFL